MHRPNTRYIVFSRPPRTTSYNYDSRASDYDGSFEDREWDKSRVPAPTPTATEEISLEESNLYANDIFARESYDAFVTSGCQQPTGRLFATPTPLTTAPRSILAGPSQRPGESHREDTYPLDSLIPASYDDPTASLPAQAVQFQFKASNILRLSEVAKHYKSVLASGTFEKPKIQILVHIVELDALRTVYTTGRNREQIQMFRFTVADDSGMPLSIVAWEAQATELSEGLRQGDVVHMSGEIS